MTKFFHSILLISTILSFFSCSQKPPTNLSFYRILASGLNNSNVFIRNENILLLNAVQKKTSDQSVSTKASFWFSKALIIQNKSMEIMAFIDSLKEELKQGADSKMQNGKLLFDEGSIKAVSDLFDKKGRGEQLKSRILDFEEIILSADPMINLAFKNTVSYTIRLSDPSEDSPKTFTKTFFEDVPVVGAIAVLDKFQNDLMIFQNQLFAFCNDRIAI